MDMPDLKGKAALEESRTPVLSRRGADVAPLSFAQERLWLIDAAAPGSVTYNVPLLSRWHEPVDPAALGVALDALVARHDVLRTSYHLTDGDPVQVVADQGTIPVEVVHVDGDRDVWARVREDAATRAVQPFDLAEGPVARCVVWRGAPGADAVLLCVHHIAIDGWSLASLYEDLALAYEAALAGRDPEWTDLPVRYTDFAAWDRETFADPASRRLLTDRLAELTEVRPGLPLAGARPRPVRPEGDRTGRDHVLALPGQIWSGVGELAKRLRATPFVVLLAAYQATLLRWSGRAEFLVGAVTVNRPRSELERLVGFFVNTVPLRGRPSPEWTFERLCREVRAEAFRSLTYQRIPFDRLTAAAGVREGLVDVGFALQNFPAPRLGAAPRWSPPEVLPTGTAKFDLLLTVEERADGVVVVLEYDTGRYPAEVAERIGATFVEILTEGVADAARELSALGNIRPDPELLATVLATVDDKAARPVLESLSVPEGSRALRDAAELFAAVLSEGEHGRVSADRFGADTDFFTSGGHSLLVVRMLAEAQRRHGVTVSPRDFLAAPTVAGLAGLLAVATTAAPAVAAPAAADESHPATSVQQRFWFLDRIPALRQAYLVPTVLELTGEVDRDALRRAVELVLARHPALRSRFRLDRKLRAVGYRTDGPAPVVTMTEASALRDEELHAHLAESCWTPFDLAADAPARAEILTAPGRTLLVLVVHHIVADGWSRELLVEQVAEVYRAELARLRSELPDPVHPAMLATSDPGEDRVAAVVERLRGAPTDIWLPHDRARPEVQATVATTCTVTLGMDLAGRLRTLANSSGCTTFMLGAALLATTLARRSDQRDFLFAFPWAGREAPGSEHAVGMFVNTLVLRVDLTGTPTWRELLARVREHSMSCYRDADVAFDAVAGALHPERDLSRPPLTPVYLSAQDGHPDPPSPHQGVATRYLPLDPLLIKYELELVLTEHAGDLELAASYAVDLFDDHTIAGLLDDMVAHAVDLAADPDAHPVEGI